MQPIDEQVSSAIAAGFSTVLRDGRAQQTEMLTAQREMIRSLQTVAATLAGGSGSRRALNTFTKTVDGSEQPTDDEHQGSRASKASGGSVRAHRKKATQTSDTSESDVTATAPVQQYADVFAQKAGPAAVFGSLPTKAIKAEKFTPQVVFKGNTYKLDTEETTQNLRARVAKSIAGSAEAWAYKPVQAPEGGGIANINGQLMKFSGAVHHLDENGNPFDAAGNALDAAEHLTPVSAAEQAQVTRRLALAHTATDASAAFAQGAPVGHALAAFIPGAVSTLATAAVGYEALNKGAEFVQGQVAANRGLQSHYGGSINDQWGDRAAQWYNRNITGRFSSLGAENYDELFQGAEGLGLRGNRRQSYIGTGAGIMMTGANADQTKEIMGTALETGQGLQGLTKAIKSVGDAARDAGIDAAKARDVFIKNYSASSDMLFGSPGAAKDLATFLTNFSTSNGQAYQGVDYSGITSENTNVANAARLGLSPTQFTAASRVNPVLPIAASEDNAKKQLSAISGSDGRTFPQWVTDYLTSHPDWDPNLEADLIDITDYLTDQGGFRPDIIAGILQMNGTNVAIPDQAPGIAAKMFTTDSMTQQALNQQTAKTQSLARTDPNKVDPTYGNSDTDIKNINSNWEAARLASVGSQTNLQHGQNSPAKVAPYPVVEALYQDRDALGIQDPSKQKVRVTKQGKLAVVSLEEAISVFPDQIQDGSAVFLGGVNDGKSVAEAMSLPSDVTAVKSTSGADMNPKTAAGIPDKDFTDPKIDQSFADYKKAQDAATNKTKAKTDASTSSTKVTIDLDPKIKPYFIALAQQANGGASAYSTGPG